MTVVKCHKLVVQVTGDVSLHVCLPGELCAIGLFQECASSKSSLQNNGRWNPFRHSTVGDRDAEVFAPDGNDVSELPVWQAMMLSSVFPGELRSTALSMTRPTFVWLGCPLVGFGQGRCRDLRKQSAALLMKETMC